MFIVSSHQRVTEYMAINGAAKVKTTWLLPKNLVRQIKQYALDNETTSTAVVIEACNEYLSRRKKLKEK